MRRLASLYAMIVVLVGSAACSGGGDHQLPGSNGGAGISAGGDAAGSGGAPTVGGGGGATPTSGGGAAGSLAGGGAAGQAAEDSGRGAGAGGAPEMGGNDASMRGTGGVARTDGGPLAERTDAAGSGGSPGSGTRDGSADPPVGPDPSAAARSLCTGADPISCHFGGQPGNYDVTVVLGGATAANTIVQAERMRTMLGAVATGDGERRRFTFTVNVREPEGEPIQAVPPGTPGLDVYFLGNGAAPSLDGIGFALASNPFVIYLAGDSTVCDQSTIDYGGWGQQLPQHFNYPVSVANYADSGESSGSFLNSGSLFGAITSRLKANDWVLIQFGHNDKDVTATAFHDNMTRLVTGVKAKAALPVLVTPVARATFSGSTLTPQHINSTGADLPAIVRQVAAEQNVPVLDLTARSITWLNQLGPNGWQAYHALGTDMTHTNPAGANVLAGFVVDLIKQANLTALVSRMR